MNQGAPDMYYQTHMPAVSAPPPQASMSSPYPHQQPTLLQPGPAQYAPAYGTQYAYANGLTSPSTGPPVTHSMQGQNVLPLPSVGAPPQGYNPHGFDTTGQVAPHGMKPRVTATLWEDEGSLCFQVEARGICVARRDDNHMINGTKLLNVAGMTRGRRDGILKSEKTRHVVKIGPMHLKGVWIPFERALDFANKEKITDLLYPLFVHNIGALLYHPTNQTRTSQVMAAAERRKMEHSHMRNAQSISHGLPSMQQHHHAMPLPAPPGQSALSSQNSMGHRPSIDRSHTFPTPPTSASSVLGMGASEGYHWSQPQAMGGSQGNAPMSIDTSLSNTRSMPTTPATTPPGNNIQSMQQYPAVSQSYDRSMYSASAPQQSPYPPTTTNAQDRSLYGGQQGYVKSEMGPPTVRPLMNDPADVKSSNGMLHSGQSGDSVSHQAAEEDQDAEQHDAEYTHDSGAYDASRASYNYNPPAVNSLPGEHSHLSPEMTGSPHQAGSGRATPRTAPQTYYSQQGYNTPPRIQTSSSNLYSVMSNDRGPTNGAPSNDVFATQADMTNPMQNGYPGAAPLLNGSSGSLKRGRDDDDQRSTSGDGPMGLDLKRRKTIIDPQMPSPTYQSPMVQPAPAMQAVPRRR